MTLRLFVRCCDYRLGYAEWIPAGVETLLVQLGKLLDQWTIIRALPRLVQFPAIDGSILHRDDDSRKSCPHEFQIHGKPTQTRTQKEKAAEIFTFQRLIFLDGVEGGTSGGIAANSSKSIKFSYLRTKILHNL